MPHETILLIDDEPSVTDGLSLLLERAGRTTIVCPDVESAELMLAHHSVTHVLTDVQFTGPFGFEGLHFLSRLRARLPAARISLMTGRASQELSDAALSAGANAMLSKPFSLAELAEALAIEVTHGDDDAPPHELLRVPTIDEIIDGDLLQMVYQPIVSLEGAVPLAFEALARVGSGWPAGPISTLFEYAAKLDRVVQLNLAAVQRAIEGAAELPHKSMLFINVDPSTFEEKTLTRVVATAAARTGFSLDRLVLEITERCSFHDAAAASTRFEELRALGVRFALDDHGSAHSHLSLMTSLAPSFIKISNSFGTDLEQDPAKARIVGNIASLARDFGCRTIVEGIETEDTARAAAALGADLGQGWHFGHPRAALQWGTGAVA